VAFLKGELPLAAQKIKVPKKNTEKAEELLSAFDRLKAWTEEHAVAVSVCVVLLSLVPVAFWGIGMLGQSKERKGQEAYALVFEKWSDKDISDSKAWEGIIPQLEKCIADHPGTRVSMDARLDLAQASFRVGRYEDARRWAAEVVEKASPGNDLKPLARYQLAQYYEMLGKVDEAVAEWEALRKEELSGLNREVDWHIADLYVKKGDYSKAVSHYESALDASGSYPSAPMLQEELAFAKTKIGSASGNTQENGTKADSPG
jgi:predicted negative regulator of RcsB-dependent stress response